MARKKGDIWTIWALDVWGNSEDGFEVNDRSPIGRIELPDDVSDTWLIRILSNGRYLGKTVSPRDFDIDQSSYEDIFISAASNGEPLLQLTRE